MMCIWTAQHPDKAVTAQAVRAAVQMLRAIDRFNQRHSDTPFHTRIGLHAGRVALGLIGGETQYTLAVGGDVANTAARLENDINKLLHTRLLVSDAVVSNFDFAVTRKVGTFVLRGKTTELEAHEILDRRKAPLIDLRRFHDALVQFESGSWGDAKDLFHRLNADFPDDGPSRFYKRLVDMYAEGSRQPPVNGRPGVIDLNEKWLFAELVA